MASPHTGPPWGVSCPPNQPKLNSQHPPQQPQPAELKQSQPPAPANGIQQWSFNPWNIQQRPSNQSNNLSPFRLPPQQSKQSQPQPEPNPEPKESPPPSPAPAKEYLIIAYKERHVLVAKPPTLAELKQAAVEIFDIILDKHKHLYAFAYYKPIAAEPALELEIHESAYSSLRDRHYVLFKHREREAERRRGQAVGMGQAVGTGRDGSSGGNNSGGASGGSSCSERQQRPGPTVEDVVAGDGQQQGRGYSCGRNSLNGTGQHTGTSRQQVFGGSHSNLNGAVLNHFESQFPSSSSSSRPWWSTAVELGSHLNCGTYRRQNTSTASRSGEAQGQQQHEPRRAIHGFSNTSNVNGVGAGNNNNPQQPEVSSSFFIPLELSR